MTTRLQEEALVTFSCASCSCFSSSAAISRYGFTNTVVDRILISYSHQHELQGSRSMHAHQKLKRPQEDRWRSLGQHLKHWSPGLACRHRLLAPAP